MRTPRNFKILWKKVRLCVVLKRRLLFSIGAGPKKKDSILPPKNNVKIIIAKTKTINEFIPPILGAFYLTLILPFRISKVFCLSAS